MQLRKLTTPQSRLENDERDHDEPSRKRNSKSMVTVIEASSTHIRVHKSWRWIFIALFILSKIFLFFAIYYFIMYRMVTTH